MYILIPVLVALVILSAYFSATETAFSSINKTKLKTIAEKGDTRSKRAKLVLELTDKYDRLISTILIGNNIVNITASTIATVLFIELMHNHATAPTVSTIVITIIILIFGEITPKSLAKDYPEKFAMFSAPIINALIYILLPLNAIFSLWKKLISKGIKAPSTDEEKTSPEELLMFVDEVEQEGSIDEKEGELLRNVIEFTERRADDVLTHRKDLVAVAIDDTLDDIADVFSTSQFSRLLVYRESIDTIIGVIHQKDFFGKNGIAVQSIEDIMSSVVYIQPSELINDLLMTLQKEQTHVAVVLDEYGGTQGIVTMEDILEELVGEIWDEHDEVEEEEEAIREIAENTYLIDCTTDLEELTERLGLAVDSESETVGGFIMEKFGTVPEVGETYTDDEITVTVRAAEAQRITTVELILHLPTETEEA